MPIFYFLVILAAIFLWLLSSFLYKPIGKFFYRIWNDAKEIIDEQEDVVD